MLKHLLTGSVLAVLGCAHQAPLPPPPPSRCAELEGPEVEARYPATQWVVGLGEASGGASEAEARQKAEADATSRVVSQLLVRVQSDLVVDQRESSYGGSSSSVARKVKSQVESVQVPGLRIVDTCYDPATLRTVSLAVLNKSEAAAALSKGLSHEAKALAAESTALQRAFSQGRVLTALSQASVLDDRMDQWRRQEALSMALGNAATPGSPLESFVATRQAASSKRVVAVVRTGEATETGFEPLSSAAAAAAAASGWRTGDKGRETLVLRVGVQGCAAQPVPALGGQRVRCSLAVSLVDPSSGDALKTLDLGAVDGVGATRLAGVANLVRQASGAVDRAVREALAALDK